MDEIPKQSIQPCIDDINDIKYMLKKNYGLTTVSMKALNGYDDRNYHVIVECSTVENDYITSVCEDGYLVKVINSFDSAMPNYHLAQKLVMDRLNFYGIKCQKEVKTVEGNYFSSVNVNKEGESESIRYMVSVRDFIPGYILKHATLTSSLVQDVGLLTGKICKCLKGFECHFYDEFLPLWNMDKVLRVRTVMHAVRDKKHKQIAEEILQAFETKVLPMRNVFRKGLIHGDLNEQNILINKTEYKQGKICGLLDFQDTCLSYPVYDLGIAIAYMMMIPSSEIPFYDVGGHLLASYTKVVNLLPIEKDHLKTITASRMVMSLVYGAYFYSLDPSNDYFLETSGKGWEILHQLWDIQEDDLWTKWNEICNRHSNTESIHEKH